MENKKCENCQHWSVTNPPSIGKCSKRNATTIFSDVCSQFEANIDYLKIFNDIFGGISNIKVPQ